MTLRGLLVLVLVTLTITTNGALRTVTAVNGSLTGDITVRVQSDTEGPWDHTVPQYSQTTFQIADSAINATIYDKDFTNLGSLPGYNPFDSTYDTSNHFRVELSSGGSVRVYSEPETATGAGLGDADMEAAQAGFWWVAGLGLGAFVFYAIRRMGVQNHNAP